MKTIAIKAIACLCALAMSPPFAKASNIVSIKNGNELLDDCSHPNSVLKSALCLGYVEGVADTLGSGSGVKGFTACQGD